MTQHLKQARDAINRIKWYNGTEEVGIIEFITFEEFKTILSLLDKEIGGCESEVKCSRCNDTGKWGWSESPDLYDCLECKGRMK